MANRLPGINYRAPVATDDLGFQQKSDGEEQQQRTRLVMAGNFGIVDAEDPRGTSIVELNRALNVLPSTDPVRVDVAPGTAVTECGNWVTLDNKIFLLEMASTAVGAVNVVFLEYALEEGTDRRLNKFNVLVAVQQERPADNDSAVKVVTIANFLDSAQFPPSRREDLVVLAVVTINQLADLTFDATIDLGGNNFTFNRPWYSPTDIQHRQQLGTATPTDANPHGTSLNDLAAGRLTLYQQSIPHGIVLSKDVALAKVPGLKATETIQAASFQTDTDGSVTGQSTLYGGVGAMWANLQHFPIVMGSVYETGTPALQISADFFPDKNILVIPPNEPIPAAGVTVEYLYAQAGEGPVDPATNDLTFSQPANSELIIADGIAVSDIPTPTISFDGSGPIPRDFRVLIDSEGDLISTPQILLTATKLDALGTNIPQTITRSMQGDAPIEVGLTRVSNVTGMTVSILIVGTGVDDLAKSETLTFNFGTYKDSAIPATSEEQDQFVRSIGIYRTLSSITISERTNDGNDSTIIVYADQEGAVTDTFQEKCPLADVLWDGLAVDTVADARPVSLDLNLAETPVFNDAGTNPDGLFWLYEDLRNPRYGDSFSGDADATSAVGSIVVSGNALFADGDTIDLGDGKVLKAKIPIQATGVVAGLDFGIEIDPGARTFFFDESPVGGNSLNAVVSPGPTALADLAVQLEANMNAASAVDNGGVGRVVYTVTVNSQRQFIIQGSGDWDIPSTASLFAVKIGFSVPQNGSDTYTGTSLAGLADGDSFTLNDGVTEKIFEFDTGNGVTAPNVLVNVPSSASLATEVTSAIVDALAAQNLLGFGIVGVLGTGSNVDLTNLVPGNSGNVTITESISTGSTLNPSGMTGGSDGGADITVGEFNLGFNLDADTTVANIIATLADPTFDSKITGTTATINTFPSVSLVRDVPGLQNNALVGVFANVTDPADLVGFERGTNKYIGVSPDAFAEGLRTRIPVAGTDLDQIRKKYRSQSISKPTSFALPPQKISAVLHNPKHVTEESVRIRHTLASNPGNWQSYQFMPIVATNPNFVVMETDFGAPIEKIQFELFGQFTDFSLVDLTNVLALGQGPTGAAGTDGADGATGADGSAGATGAAGVEGDAGAVGATGPAASSFRFDAIDLTTWTIVHNLGTTDVTYAAYELPGSFGLIPNSVEIVDANTVVMTFSTDTTGFAVIQGVS